MNKTIIGVIIAAIILAGGYVVYQSNKNIQIADRQDWQTYRNDNYGFEFKYPQGWQVEETDGPPGVLGQVMLFDSQSTLDITVIDKKHDFTWWTDTAKDKNDEFNKPGSVIVDGVAQAASFSKEFYESGPKVYIEISHGNFIYHLVVSGPMPDLFNENTLILGEKYTDILKTFKFSS